MNLEKEFLIIVPARKGSQRIKGKNSKKINGKPLYWTLKELKTLKDKIDIVITTDDRCDNFKCKKNEISCTI